MEIVAVFDSSSPLSKSVAITLLKNNFVVRCLTTNRAECQILEHHGAELYSQDQIDDCLKGVQAAYVSTTSNFDSITSVQDEIDQGRTIAEACQRARVEHLIYSTQLSVAQVTGMTVRHMDAKSRVEDLLFKTSIPLTKVIIPPLYEYILEPSMIPTRLSDNQFGLEIPMSNVPLDLICLQDVGYVILEMIIQRKALVNKTLSLSATKLTVRDLASILTHNLTDYKFKDSQVTVEQYQERRRFKGVIDWSYQFDFYVRVDQKASIELTKHFYPHIKSFGQWVEENKAAIYNTLNKPMTPAMDPFH
ncbi:DgyrCDS11303 [Dimorphilus gyrociliatus]|uniref:NmrA-like family domain-containing protein 1 n=1 Tax=Dimorphilus gyrociliatus TaxID=2664684 RepID=A0A7I8W5E9_9ANNE|nr:DgyrCDS11303 [Dimorphilus gyrociliatus]